MASPKHSFLSLSHIVTKFGSKQKINQLLFYSAFSCTTGMHWKGCSKISVNTKSMWNHGFRREKFKVSDPPSHNVGKLPPWTWAARLWACSISQIQHSHPLPGPSTKLCHSCQLVQLFIQIKDSRFSAVIDLYLHASSQNIKMEIQQTMEIFFLLHLLWKDEQVKRVLAVEIRNSVNKSVSNPKVSDLIWKHSST